jgi:hypothetical protein
LRIELLRWEATDEEFGVSQGGIDADLVAKWVQPGFAEISGESDASILENMEDRGDEFVFRLRYFADGHHQFEQGELDWGFGGCCVD